jgi:hypothetical protein
MKTVNDTIDLTDYILQVLEDDAGRTAKHPVVIGEGLDDYVDIEYGVLRALGQVLRYRYVVIGQIYQIRKGRCLDRITIKRNDRRVVHFWFDVTAAVSKY